MNKVLYIFIDESGNLIFTPKSTAYFAMTACVTDELSDQLVVDFFRLKNELLLKIDDLRKISKINYSYKLDYFHASEDLQIVRDSVFKVIERQKDIKVFSIITEKRKTHPKLQNANGFYIKNAKWLIHEVFKYINFKNYARLVIFFDDMPVAKNKEALFKGVKSELTKFFLQNNISIPYTIHSHQSKANFYLQLVDYISWAIFINNERGEQRPYQQIKKFIMSEFQPFKDGPITYY